MLETTDDLIISRSIAALRRDYESLSVRIRKHTRAVKCDADGVKVHLHFPAISQGRATIWELVNVILDYMTPFALHQSQIDEVYDLDGQIPKDQYRMKLERLQREALSLFIRAQREANRNGEAGELLLFIMTEWILNAPQLLAKVPLKSNRNVPVHGTDGIHIAYLSDRNTVCTYWGEAKLVGNIDDAIRKAVRSIKTAIKPGSTQFELALVSRHLMTTGLSADAQKAIKSYLNPFDSENYNRRVDATTCLIGFDFDGYEGLKIDGGDDEFCALAAPAFEDIARRFSKSLKAAGVRNRLIELFFFPVPSVDELRRLFQSKIGWNDASGSC